MEKLSDLRHKTLDEDWRDDARAAKAAKSVKDIHRNRLDKLSFEIDTSFGEFKLNIKPSFKGGSELRVYLGDDYLFYEIFENAKDLKKFIEEKLAEVLYEKIRGKFADKIQKMPRAEAKTLLKRFDGLLDELDKGIKLEIDFDELEKACNRYGVYSRAMDARYNNKSSLENRARRKFEKEHGFEVGDVVYGTRRSDLREGKAYVVVEIEKTGKDNQYWKYKLKPENGLGRGGTAYGYQLYLDSDTIDAAVNNPDDPKYEKKFDQQQYMMDRYSNNFDEAVELLKSCGMIVEAKS